MSCQCEENITVNSTTTYAINMSDYKVFNCTVDDAAGLAKCNMTSFYQEPSWNIMWKHTTLDFLIQNTTSRLPKNLLTERGVRRHQKVVHAPSNTIVGYIKWILPESAQNEWLAAQVPDVNDNDHKRFAELHSTTIFDPQQLPEVSDDHYKVWKEKHGPHGPHIGRYGTEGTGQSKNAKC